MELGVRTSAMIMQIRLKHSLKSMIQKHSNNLFQAYFFGIQFF
jgi:hypothetical protein